MDIPLGAAAPATVVAAVDVGTNSIKMTVARRCPGQDLEILDSASETVRLGEGVATTGQLAPDRIAAALATLTRFAERARSHGNARLVGVATEATRRAANGEEFLTRAREETGWNVTVITGDEEAVLTFRGLAEDQDLTGTVLAADIGGGSTELILAREGRVDSSESISLGSGLLTEELISADPPTADEIDAVRAAATGRLAAIARQASKIDRLIVLGGTAEHLARLVPDPGDVADADIGTAMTRVCVVAARELATQLGIAEARARVLPAGVAIISALVDRVRPAKIVLAQSGIRTGLILATLAGIDAAVAVDARVGRDPKHPRDAMRIKLAMLWENVWNAMPAAIAGEDPEGVHAVRVASRRLRAGMATATGYFPQKWYRRLHETARDITGDLGAVRDRDVLLEALANIRSGRLSSQERTALDHLIARVTAERDAARQTLLAFVADLDTRGIRAETQRRFAAPVAKSPSRAAKKSRRRKRERNRTQRRATRLRLAADARHALKPRIAELFAFDQAIRDPDRVREHHRARIAAKRLRYTLELFADQFGDAGERAIQEMKELQEELGVIHDIDVQIALIDDEGLRLAPGGGVDPRLAAGFAKLRERQGKLRGEHHLALVDRWTRLEEAGFRRDLRRLTRKKP